MRVLELITPSNIGGAENYVLNISKKLKEKGHDVYILSSNPLNKKNTEMNMSEFFSKSGLSFNVFNIGFKYSPIAILKLLYFAKRNKIDLIHTHLSKANVIGGIVAKILKIKSVATAHGLNKKSQYKYSGFIICVSNAVKNNLLSQGIEEKSEIAGVQRLSIIYNGIDTDKFNPDDAKLLKKENESHIQQNHNSEDGDWLNIGIISRLSPEKGVGLFLESAGLALGKNRHLRFFVAGAGVLKDELTKKAKKLGIENSVYFLGFVGDNLVYFINELDVVAFPSIKEGLPLSLLESMSMRKAVIVSNVGGMPEVVEDGKNGFIVGNGDVQALSLKIDYLYNNRGIIEKAGNEARKTVLEKFSLNIMADKIEELFKNISNIKSI